MGRWMDGFISFGSFRFLQFFFFFFSSFLSSPFRSILACSLVLISMSFSLVLVLVVWLVLLWLLAIVFHFVLFSIVYRFGFSHYSIFHANDMHKIEMTGMIRWRARTLTLAHINTHTHKVGLANIEWTETEIQDALLKAK